MHHHIDSLAIVHDLGVDGDRECPDGGRLCGTCQGECGYISGSGSLTEVADISIYSDSAVEGRVSPGGVGQSPHDPCFASGFISLIEIKVTVENDWDGLWHSVTRSGVTDVSRVDVFELEVKWVERLCEKVVRDDVLRRCCLSFSYHSGCMALVEGAKEHCHGHEDGTRRRENHVCS